MGFEYKVVIKLNDTNKQGIENIITELQNQTASKDKWPDAYIKIEEDGIYICQNRISNVFEGLEKIKNYLTGNNLNYTIEEL